MSRFKILSLKNFNQLNSLLRTNYRQPFSSPWYQKLFADHFSKTENLLILGIFDKEKLVGSAGFEKYKNKLIFIGMKPVESQELTDYGDIFLKINTQNNTNRAWTAILEYLKKNKLSKYPA